MNARDLTQFSAVSSAIVGVSALPVAELVVGVLHVICQRRILVVRLLGADFADQPPAIVVGKVDVGLERRGELDADDHPVVDRPTIRGLLQRDPQRVFVRDADQPVDFE